MLPRPAPISFNKPPLDPYRNPNAPNLNQWVDDQQKRQKERFHIIVIDSADRNMTKFPNMNDFTVEVAAPLRNVQGVRLMKAEFADINSDAINASIGYLVIGDATANIIASLPYTSPVSSTFISLNGYDLIKLANRMENPVFARLPTSQETYPLSAKFMEDPNTYVVNPVDSALSRFEVKLINGSGTLATMSSTSRVILTLGISCIN